MEQEAPPLFRSKLIESFLDFMQSPYALIGLLQRFRRYFKDQAGIPGTGVTMSKIRLALTFNFTLVINKYLIDFTGYLNRNRDTIEYLVKLER